MFKTLLCRMNLAHHWLATEVQDGYFRRRCMKCGKYDPHSKALSERIGSGNPVNLSGGGINGIAPSSPFISP
jgi:hypothetical protein